VVDFVGYPHHFQKIWPKKIVARVRRRGDRPPHSPMCVYLENMGRQGILVFYQWKNGMESPPGIMVTRNPN